MKIIRSKKQMYKRSGQWRQKGLSIGFVPTMGFFHKGHLSLIKYARKRVDRLVVSIFVNPAQFGPKEDLSVYPRDFNRDKKLCKDYGVDVIFYPSETSMYDLNHLTFVDVSELSDILCGKSRPDHFKGVTTIVCKLFSIIQPDTAFFGQKDIQQAVIIKKMVNDLDIPVKIKVLPIIRDKDGLALSSRNVYLSGIQRQKALILYQSLQQVKNMIESSIISASIIRQRVKKIFNMQSGVKLDYFEIVDPKTLQSIKGLIKGKVIVLGAIYIGKVRLIDNVIAIANKIKDRETRSRISQNFL